MFPKFYYQRLKLFVELWNRMKDLQNKMRKVANKVRNCITFIRSKYVQVIRE